MTTNNKHYNSEEIKVEMIETFVYCMCNCVLTVSVATEVAVGGVCVLVCAQSVHEDCIQSVGQLGTGDRVESVCGKLEYDHRHVVGGIHIHWQLDSVCYIETVLYFTIIERGRLGKQTDHGSCYGSAVYETGRTTTLAQHQRNSTYIHHLNHLYV